MVSLKDPFNCLTAPVVSAIIFLTACASSNMMTLNGISLSLLMSLLTSPYVVSTTSAPPNSVFLSFPVKKEARGEDNKMRPMSRRSRLNHPFLYTSQKTYRLQGLSKPHVIGKAGSQPVLIEE